MAEWTDAEYDAADAIMAAMEAAPDKTWTASTIGRKVKVSTHLAGRVLDKLVGDQYVQSTDRGAWSRYSLVGWRKRAAQAQEG